MISLRVTLEFLALALLITIVPMLYGILALSTRQFIVVGVWFFALYGTLHLG